MTRGRINKGKRRKKNKEETKKKIKRKLYTEKKRQKSLKQKRRIEFHIDKERRDKEPKANPEQETQAPPCWTWQSHPLSPLPPAPFCTGKAQKPPTQAALCVPHAQPCVHPWTRAQSSTALCKPRATLGLVCPQGQRTVSRNLCCLRGSGGQEGTRRCSLLVRLCGAPPYPHSSEM